MIDTRVQQGLLWAALAAASAAPAQTPAPTPSPAAADPPPSQQVEVTGVRSSDTEQRRQSTAAKIVIGREEIDKFGDSTLGEVLRRLPGVTTPGAPGRGGAPRLRGLGNGYTQLLIDGQPVPRGFSLESLSPEQVERIEILRAPTAETGARAIAGTINIVTRDGFRRRVNDLRLGLGLENGRLSPSANWSRNDSAGPLTYNVSASASRNRRASESVTETVTESLEDGSPTRIEHETAQTRDARATLNLNSRLQWRLGEGGDQLTLSPSLFHSEFENHRRLALTQLLSVPPAPAPFDAATTNGDGHYTVGRLNGQYRGTLAGGARLEFNGGLGGWRSLSDSSRAEYRDGDPLPLRTRQDLSRTSEHSANLNAKISTLFGGDEARPGSEHSLVSGAELEAVRRTESRQSQGTGSFVGADGDDADNLQATSLRLAGYLQDEWQITPHWAAQAGLRWEGITTRGQADDGSRPENRSSVWTPLLHAVWKPDPKSRDQLRVSLTRSYRSPGLGSLIARRSINDRFPSDGPNDALNPDRVGNPDLRPELATGIDVAAERYLAGGGVLSANVFHRRIRDLIRSVTELQAVPWSPVPRWVAQQRNVGNATTRGIELEAKYRLDQWIPGALPVEMRHNLAVYRSRVDGVPGPDNRLDQQAKATANLGADYRLRGLPLTLGGNVNWVPGYRTRLSDEQVVTAGRKRVVDGYALWAVNPHTALRLTASNLAPLDYASSNAIDSLAAGLRETATTTGPSYLNWQLRLELKL